MNLDGLPYALMPMRLADVPTVSEIEEIVFSLPWTTTAFRYEVRHNATSEYLVLRYLPWVNKAEAKPLLRPIRRLRRAPRHDLSLLGYAGFWMMLDEAHICTLAIRPEWRGRGLGELLVMLLMESALARKARVATLEVRVSNAVAQNLYAKYGFDIVGRRKRYYSDNGEDAYTMSTGPITSTSYKAGLRQLGCRLRQRLLAQANLPAVEALHSP